MSTIAAAFSSILKYGNPMHRRIILDIQRSSMRLSIENIPRASADTGLIDKIITQQKIDTQRLNIIQAFGEIRIRVHPITASTNAGLEGTLVHETRHAFHQARAISDFSEAPSLNRPPYNPDGFTIEYAAHVAYVEYVLQAIRLNHPDKLIFINEAVNGLRVMKKVGNSYVIDETGIRARLASPAYGVSGKNRGLTFGDNWKLTPRNSW